MSRNAHSFWSMALAFVLLSGIVSASWLATCTGASPCKACKNCKYCKHCAKDGGKCGVCKPSA